MDKKFLVFVVFAIVTQNSVLLSSATFEGFSEEAYASLDLLTTEDFLVRKKGLEGVWSFFDLLKNGDDQNQETVNSTAVLQALSPLVDATDIVFYSALQLVDGDCTVFETAFNESRIQLNGSFQAVICALELSHGGNYEYYQSEIEEYRNLTQTGFIRTFAALFDLLRCCLSESSEEFKNLTNEVEEKLAENFVLITDDLYKAIEAYGILTSDKYSVHENEISSPLVTIHESKIAVMTSVMSNIKHIYALYETRFIDVYLNHTDIVYKLYILRIARKIISDKFYEIIEVVFISIAEKLIEHVNDKDIIAGYYPADDLIVTNATEAIAVGFLQDAGEIFLNTVLFTLQNSTDKVIVAEMIFPRIIPVIISHYYQGIALADTELLPHHLSLLAIESVGEIQSLVSNFLIGEIFEVIGKDECTEAILEKLQNRVMNSTQVANDVIFNGIEVLSGAAHAVEGANRDDLNKVLSQIPIAISTIFDAVKFVFAAILYKLVVEHGY